MPKPSAKNMYQLVIPFDRRQFEELSTALREGFNFERAGGDKFSGLYIIANSIIETNILLLKVAELLLYLSTLKMRSFKFQLASSGPMRIEQKRRNSGALSSFCD